MPSLSADPVGINLSSVFSPIYWGFVISLLLGGITIVQAYIYFPHPNDRLSIQLTAAAMLILDVTSSALVSQSVFYYLIPQFGSLEQFTSVTPELSAECLLSGIITFISQMYFVHQLYTVKHLGKGTRVLIVIITISACLAFLGGISCVAAMYIFHHGVLSNRNNMFAIFFGLAKGFGATTDIIATIAMCKFLSSSKTGMQQTNSILKSLMQFVVQRGVVVTLIQTLLLITFYAAPTRLYWFAFHINVTKLYANTFFAMLNGRDHIKEKHFTLKSSMISSHGSGSSQGNAKSKLGQDNFAIGQTESQDLTPNEDKAYPMTNMPTVTKTVVITDL